MTKTKLTKQPWHCKIQRAFDKKTFIEFNLVQRVQQTGDNLSPTETE